MADFDALDGRLRDALGQAAQQGDSAGVADAIRARVAAGDPGTSVASSSATSATSSLPRKKRTSIAPTFIGLCVSTAFEFSSPCPPRGFVTAD